MQERVSFDPLNTYTPFKVWSTVRLMLILQCMLGLKSQSIDLYNDFVKAYTPKINMFVLKYQPTLHLVNGT